MVSTRVGFFAKKKLKLQNHKAEVVRVSLSFLAPPIGGPPPSMGGGGLIYLMVNDKVHTLSKLPAHAKRWVQFKIPRHIKISPVRHELLH